MKPLVLLLTVMITCNLAVTQPVAEYQWFHVEGRKQMQGGNYQAAIDSFTLAIIIMPYYSAIYLERGEARLRMNDFARAVDDFTYVIEKTPYKTFAFLGRGISYYQLNQLNRAKNDFQQVLERQPDNFEALKYLRAIDAPLEADTKDLEPTSVNENSSSYLGHLREKYYRNRPRDYLIWGYTVPLSLWTAAFLIWY